ncbi:MAG: ketopantoate reductase family protein, partial [Limnohabitans sp.]
MSDMNFHKIAIVGAGAIGGWMGVHLARAGAKVSVLARNDTLAALQRDGLQLHEGGERYTVPVQASGDAAALGVQDLGVSSVKAPALASVAQQVAPLLGPDTVVLTAMNGVPWWFLQGFGGPVKDRSLRSVDPEGQIARAIPAEHIMGSVVHASCSVDAPGVIRHHFGDGHIVGEPSGQITPRAQALQALL